MIQSGKISSTQGISIRRIVSAPPPAGNSPRSVIAGTSLVELMIAVVILGMVFGSAFGVLGQGFNIIETSRDYTRVSQILQSEMESLRTKNWTELTALPAKAEFEPDPSFVLAFKDRYTCTRVLTKPEVDQRKILLIVSWKTRKGPLHTRFYTTKYTKNGINDFYIRTF